MKKKAKKSTFGPELRYQIVTHPKLPLKTKQYPVFQPVAHFCITSNNSTVIKFVTKKKLSYEKYVPCIILHQESGSKEW